MAQKNTLFDRLALKETVKINKQLQGLNTLREELKKISSMRDKLEDMASQTGHEYAGQSGFSLWSAARLNQKIRDQLDTARNRTEHLDEEIQEIRRNIAQSDRRRDKSKQLATTKRRVESQLRESKREDEEASRRRQQKI